MRTAKSSCVFLASVFLVACAAETASKSPLPAPASLAVDPVLELREPDIDKYPELAPFWLITPNALTSHFADDDAREAALNQLVNKFRGAAHLAEEKLRAMAEQVDRIEWVKRWAPWLGAGLLLIGGTIGAIAGHALK